MTLPTIQGIIERRILLNYRISPKVAETILPSNFTPKLVDGYAIAGICLIRLAQIRPKGMPACVGISSENSAHRIAVEWQDGTGQMKEGVFVPRRDTDSRLNALAGGRIFPGVHHYSRFDITDTHGEISMCIKARDYESPLIDLKVRESDSFPKSSVFESLDASSRFFESGCTGYSARPDSSILDGLSLVMPKWQVSSLEVEHVQSAYYDDREIFPAGSIELDHALLMRNLAHEWHSEPQMTAA